MTGTGTALRVVLADDHRLFRDGVREMLAANAITVVGEAADGETAVRLAGELDPDVIVLDLKMPKTSGSEAVRRIIETRPGAQVLVLTVSADELDALEALAAGACGYLLKEARTEELIGAIRLARGGHGVLSPGVMQALAAHLRKCGVSAARAGTQEHGLSERELEVLRLIAEGADNATIGRELSISKHTAKQHVTSIFQKLGVRSRVQAAVFAVRNGLD